MSRAILDTELLVELRGRAGISQRQLARLTGMSVAMASALESEGGSNHGDVSLRTLLRIAAALGVEPGSLFLGDEQAKPAAEAVGDTVKVEALLAEFGAGLSATQLATALDWELGRAERAGRALRRRLLGTGQRLSQLPNLRLRAERAVLSARDLERVGQLTSGSRGFDLGCAKVLHQVLAGGVDSRWEAKASNPETVSLRRLVNLGLIRKRRGLYVASEAVQFSFVPGVE